MAIGLCKNSSKLHTDFSFGGIRTHWLFISVYMIFLNEIIKIVRTLLTVIEKKSAYYYYKSVEFIPINPISPSIYYIPSTLSQINHTRNVKNTSTKILYSLSICH